VQVCSCWRGGGNGFANNDVNKWSCNTLLSVDLLVIPCLEWICCNTLLGVDLFVQVEGCNTLLGVDLFVGLARTV
jgi:hypothetical protein